jgi:transposase
MWRRVMFSDECSVERGKGSKRGWYFKIPGTTPFDRDVVHTYPKGKQPSVMVWAGFSGLTGRTELIPMGRDPNSPRGGYSARSYIATLEEGLLPVLTDDVWFMQDNASIHTARIVQNWMREHNITLLSHPPNSPDLNPSEHGWFPLKNELNKRYPESEDIDLSKNDVKVKIQQVLPECWRAIPNELFYSLWSTMDKRIKAVIKAKGWYTKY